MATAHTPEPQSASLASRVETIPIDSIEPSAEIHARVEIDQATVTLYAAEMLDGEVFPPVVVYEDADGKRWLSDGFLRREAARFAGLETILAEIRSGSARDALFNAVGSNQTHGLRRSKEQMIEALAGGDSDEVTIVTLEGGEALQMWFKELQRQSNLPADVLLRTALAELAQDRGFRPPPGA